MAKKGFRIDVEKPADCPDYVYYRDTCEAAVSLANHQRNFIKAEVIDLETGQIIHVKESRR